MMFAGHHTTSGTAAWTLIELLRHPDVIAGVQAEIDGLQEHGLDVSYQALREIPRLESAVKEALRLHPPLILLLRVVISELAVGSHTIEPGTLVGASPAVSNRLPGGVLKRRLVRPRPLHRRAVRRTSPIRGTGSRSVPAATAASAPRSR